MLLGDELDSPRGRIYLMKQMLESGKTPTPDVVKHIDRCLSCLSCMTTCPSGVHYMHLVDHGRRLHRGELQAGRCMDRLMRRLLERVVPYPLRLPPGAACGARSAARSPSSCPASSQPCWRWRRSVSQPSPVDRPQVFPAEGERRARVALLTGCAQQVLAPQINEATIRLLTRHGVRGGGGQGCRAAAARSPTTWAASDRRTRSPGPISTPGRASSSTGGLDAVVINASGCGTTIKDYGFMFREDPAYADKAARIAGADQGRHRVHGRHRPEAGDRRYGPRRRLPLGLLDAARPAHHLPSPRSCWPQAGFTVKDVPEGHLCCGSAGTYNLLQPEIALQLRDRKVANIEQTQPDVIATGNIGCITQIASGTRDPDRAHGRAARLGDRRAEAGGARALVGRSIADDTCLGRSCSIGQPRRLCREVSG